MSIFAAVLLAAAVVLVVAAQWPKLSLPVPRRERRRRGRRGTKLRVVEPEHDDDFVRAVERDLAALPTIDEQDAKKKS
ncbi:MAG TPA: hypothetical protein VFA88_06010 [Gaiellaceae bacterium]|nr:hypothetical protein [Gaiellaceae bacterium]